MKRIVPWVALLLALVTACDGGGREDATQAPSGDRPQLVVPGSATNSVALQMLAKEHQSFVHGSFTICLDEPGEVEVTSVEFKSGNLEVTGWALRPTPGPGEDLAGDWRGATLASRAIQGTEVLTRVCDDQGWNSYELVLQVRSGESSTEGDGIIVRYTSDERGGTLSLPDRVVLCVRPERPNCA